MFILRIVLQHEIEQNEGVQSNQWVPSTSSLGHNSGDLLRQVSALLFHAYGV